MSTITKAEYMANSSELHNAYYSQFITASTISFIKENIGVKKLLSSKCKYFNDLYSMSQGANGTWIWDRTPFNLSLARELGAVSERGLGSPSVHTSIGKACAHNLIAENK